MICSRNLTYYPPYTQPSSLNAHAGCLATSPMIPNTWENRRTRAAVGHQLLPTDNSKKGVLWPCSLGTPCSLLSPGSVQSILSFVSPCFPTVFILSSYMLLLYSCIFLLYSCLISSELSFTHFSQCPRGEARQRLINVLLPKQMAI